MKQEVSGSNCCEHSFQWKFSEKGKKAQQVTYRLEEEGRYSGETHFQGYREKSFQKTPGGEISHP